jgi:hypothetical protein
MSVILPLFPLRLVVFPGEDLNLHIFEPRYKQLINECHERGTTFGIPAYIDNNIQPIGTEIELVNIDKRYDDGKMDVRTRGTGIFKVLEFFMKMENRLYTGAEIERLSFDSDGDFLKNEQILERLGELYDILQIRKPIPEHSPAFNTYQIAHLVGFTLEQEYAFLCIPEELRRQDYMLTHLDRLLPMAKEMEQLRRKVQMNGHFKNVIPPEV